MMFTRYRIEWGMSSVIALPAALSFTPQDDFGWTSFALHIGPLFVAVEWSEEL